MAAHKSRVNASHVLCAHLTECKRVPAAGLRPRSLAFGRPLCTRTKTSVWDYESGVDAGPEAPPPANAASRDTNPNTCHTGRLLSGRQRVAKPADAGSPAVRIAYRGQLMAIDPFERAEESGELRAEPGRRAERWTAIRGPRLPGTHRARGAHGMCLEKGNAAKL